MSLFLPFLFSMSLGFSTEGSDGELVVEGERETSSDSSQTSAALAVIPIDDTLAASADLAEVLGGSTGAVVRRLGGLGDFAAVSLRGSSFRQVQLFLDGFPLNPEGSDVVNLSELPLSILDRVEVFRSNPPASLGASPVGGVVNLITRPNDDQQAVKLLMGSHQTVKTTLMAQSHSELGDLESSWLLNSNGFLTQGDFDYFSDNGTIYNPLDDERSSRQNNDKGQWNGLARWRLEGARGSLSVLNSTLSRHEGLPGPGNSPSLKSRLDTRRNLLGVQGVTSGSDWTANAYVWRHDRSELYDDRSGEVGTGTQWQDDRFATTGLRTHGTWAPLSKLQASMTLSGHYDRFQRESLLTETLEDPLTRSVLSGVLALEWWALSDRLVVAPTVQMDWLFNREIAAIQEPSTGYGQESSDSLWSPNPRLGVLWRPFSGVDWVLKSTVGSYFRPPGLDEIFGDRGAIRGNKELVPESGVIWDLGTRLSFSRKDFSVVVEQGVFRNQAENKIVLIQNSQRTSVPVNFGNALVQGSETALSVSAWNLLESQTNLTLTSSLNQTELTDGAGKQLPRVPLWDIHQSTHIRLDSKVQLGHRYSWTDGNYWDVANVFLAPPRAYHSAFLRFFHKELSLEISALNLLNETVAVVDRNPFSEEDNTPVLTPLTDFLGYPLPGRSWFVELSWKQS